MRTRWTGMAIAAIVVLSLPPSAPAATPPGGDTPLSASADATALLTAVRVAAHPGFDRLVFQFSGVLPPVRKVAFVTRVVQDPSGRPLSLTGRAFVRVVLRGASAHRDTGQATYPGVPTARRNLPVFHAVVQAGDFEDVLTFGVALWQRTTFHTFTLAAPPRLVIDFTVPTKPVARLTAMDSGRVIQLHVGQQTTVALRTCVSCGDHWKVVTAPRKGVVRLVSASVVALPHAPGVVGFPSESRFALAARGLGKAALVLDEMPPGRTAKPLARFVLHFSVIS